MPKEPAKKSLKVLGIRFGDNDFHQTCRAWLEMIKWVGIEQFDHLSKAELLELFNRSAPAIYWTAQNQLRYRADETSTEKYIREKMKVTDIYINEEVAAYLKDPMTFLNGEFYVLDTQVHEPYVYSA
jgi:hypothetical protein